MNKPLKKSGNTFSRAWEIISQDASISLEEKKSIMKLIQVLLESRENTPLKIKDDEALATTQEVISKHSLMTTMKHQADELDALRRISLNLTSSLDFQTVLDAVVKEALGLVKNASLADIFLYERGVLVFGASLYADGTRNKLFSDPRPDGLT